MDTMWECLVKIGPVHSEIIGLSKETVKKKMKESSISIEHKPLGICDAKRANKVIVKDPTTPQRAATL